MSCKQQKKLYIHCYSIDSDFVLTPKCTVKITKFNYQYKVYPNSVDF